MWLRWHIAALQVVEKPNVRIFYKKKERENKNIYFDDISNLRRRTRFLCIQKQSIADLTILIHIDSDYYKKNQCLIIR